VGVVVEAQPAVRFTSVYCLVSNQIRLAYMEPDGAGARRDTSSGHTPENGLDTKLPVTLSAISTPQTQLHRNGFPVLFSVHSPATPLPLQFLSFFKRISAFHFAISLNCWKTR